MNPQFYRYLYGVIFLNVLIFSTALGQPPGFPPDYPAPEILYTDTYDGDLILSGSEVMIIENTDLTIRGNIYLSDDAQLIMRHSIITIDHYPRQEIFVSGNASLLADTTIFNELVHADFMDQSQLVFNHCVYINLLNMVQASTAVIRNSYIFQDSFGLIQLGGESGVLVQNSVVGALGLFIPPDVPCSIDGLQPGFFDSWSSAETISPDLDYLLELENVEVKDNPGYTGGIEMGWNIFIQSSNQIMINNSILNKLVINFYNEDVDVSGLLTREPVDFSYRDISLLQSTIQTQWGIFVADGETVVSNSEGVWLWPVGNKDTYVYNTEVSEFDPRNYTGTIHMENVSMTNGFEVFDNSNFRMEGDIRMMGIGPLYSNYCNLTRNYTVYLVDDETGEGMEGKNLVIQKDGTTTWSGWTDSQGSVSFDLDFDYWTHLDTWTLKCSDTTIRLDLDLSIFTSTPVMINLKQTDGSYYEQLVYVDGRSAGPGSGLKDDPFTSIGEGVRSCSRWGTVSVAPGEYLERVDLQQGVTVIGSGADSTRILGDVFAIDISDAMLSGFLITDDYTAGIHCYGSGLTAQNNIILGQPHNGVHCYNSGLRLINNNLTLNGHNGLLILGESEVEVRNNIFLDNGGAGVAGAEEGNLLSDYNDFWGNGSGAYGEGASGGNHDIFTEPGFIHPEEWNYYLGEDSPCIDAGDPDPVYNDRDSTRNDIGAFGGPGGCLYCSENYGLPGNEYDVLSLLGVSPNPFYAYLRIAYNLPHPGHMTMQVFDLEGRRKAVVADQDCRSGRGELFWNGTSVEGDVVDAGAYILSMTLDKRHLRSVKIIKR